MDRIKGKGQKHEGKFELMKQMRPIWETQKNFAIIPITSIGSEKFGCFAHNVTQFNELFFHQVFEAWHCKDSVIQPLVFGGHVVSQTGQDLIRYMYAPAVGGKPGGMALLGFSSQFTYSPGCYMCVEWD